MAATAASYAFPSVLSDKALRNGVIAGGGLAVLGAGLASYISMSSHRDAAHTRANECLSLVIQHTPERVNAMEAFLDRWKHFFFFNELFCPSYLSFPSLSFPSLSPLFSFFSLSPLISPLLSLPRSFSDPKVSDSLTILADFANPLKDLKKLTKRLGFCSGPLIVCDGLDEADLLDPAKYPGVLNHLVREICYFNILNRCVCATLINKVRKEKERERDFTKYFVSLSSHHQCFHDPLPS